MPRSHDAYNIELTPIDAVLQARGRYPSAVVCTRCSLSVWRVRQKGDDSVLTAYCRADGTTVYTTDKASDGVVECSVYTDELRDAELKER